MKKIFISTSPFAQKITLPLEMLESNKIKFCLNPHGRKMSEAELMDLVGGAQVVIAGTEPVTKKVMEKATNLKHISRVGVGLDNVDLLEAKKRGISVSYTPDAPAPAVAELTIGLMINLLRKIHIANDQMHRGKWHRHFGRRIAEVTIGIIGAGRIGARVLRRIQGFGNKVE